MHRSHITAHLRTAALVAALGFLAALGQASEDERPAPVASAEADEDPQEETHEAHGTAGEHGEGQETFAGHHVHVEHRNGLSVGIAGTWESAEDKVFSTIAVEYARMLADRWGAQLIVEHVNDFDAWVVVAPVGFRLGGTLWAVAGPGLETEPRRTALEAEPHEDPHAASQDGGHSTEAHEGGDGPFFLWRFGLVYNIHLGQSGRWGLATSLSLDLVREHGEWVEAWVFGAGVAYHF